MTRHSVRITDAEAQRMGRIQQFAALGVEAVPSLIGQLDDKSWVVRRAVVDVLAQLGDVAVGALCDALRTRRDNEARLAALMDTLAASVGDADDALLLLAYDANPAVVSDAAQILGRRRSKKSTGVLVELMSSPDDNVAVSAIEALGRIGGRAAVDSLIRAVQSGSFFRTFPSIDVLGRTGDPRAIAALAELLDDSRYAHEAARALGRTADPGAVRPLLSLFAHPSDAMVRVAAAALAELRSSYAARYGATDAIDLLIRDRASEATVRRAIASLHDAATQEREALCHVLGALGSQESVAALSDRLDGEENVARAAALALKRLGTEGALSLANALRDSDSPRRKLVLSVLTPKSLAFEDLAGCLKDPDGSVRAMACGLLGQLGDVAAVPSLFELLGDPNARVQQAVCGALHALGGDVTERLTLTAAQHHDRRVRRQALRLIGDFGYASGLEPLKQAITGDDEQLREVALHSLGFLESPAALELLTESASAENPRTRAAAIRALGQTSRSEVGALLSGALDDPDPWVRYYAAQALGRLYYELATEKLANLLSDSAGQVRVAAIEALSHLGSQAAIDALSRGALSTDLDVRRACLMGLANAHRAELLPLVIDATRSDDAPTRLVAASALSTFDAESAAVRLAELARIDTDDSVRAAALSALAERSGPRATEALIGLLGEPSCQVRVREVLALPLPGRIEGILSSLETADDELAAQLTSALARMRTGDAISALTSALHLSNPVARRAAAITAAGVGTRPLFEALERQAKAESDPEVARVILSALRN